MRPLASPLLAGLACAAVVAGCAADGGPPGPDGGPPGGGPRGGGVGRLPNVFISPAGQPFRAPPGAPYPVATWFAKADADHDGRLTRAEFIADGMAFFRTLDTNHDGVIDGFELDHYEQAIAPEILPRIEGLHAGEGMDPSLTFGDSRNQDSPRSGENGRAHGFAQAAPPRPANTEPTQGAGLFSIVNVAEPVAAADADFNGRITAAEFTAALNRRFDVLDTKGLGYLTLADLPKTPVQAAIERAAKQRRKRAR